MSTTFRKLGLLVLFALIAMFGTAAIVYAINYVQPQTEGSTTPYTFLSATTTSATSTDDASNPKMLNVTGAQKVEFYFTHGGTATSSVGTTTFKVEGSPDGSTWYSFGKLVQSTSTTLQTTASISAATNTLTYGLNIDFDTFNWLRCLVVKGSGSAGVKDGEATCAALVQY